MTALAGVMGERDIPFEVDKPGRCRCFRRWPVPTRNWPRHDRGVCTMEKMMFRKSWARTCGFRMPVGRRDVLHLHTERVICDNRGFDVLRS